MKSTKWLRKEKLSRETMPMKRETKRMTTTPRRLKALRARTATRWKTKRMMVTRALLSASVSRLLKTKI